MSEIVAELTRARMSDQWIMRHIGMDRDELLRLKQITGLAELFSDKRTYRLEVAVLRECLAGMPEQIQSVFNGPFPSCHPRQFLPAAAHAIAPHWP